MSSLVVRKASCCTLFVCDIFGIGCEERPLPRVWNREKRQRERHKDSVTEKRTQRIGSRGRGVTGVSLRPTARESHRRRLEPVFKGPNEWRWSRNRERNELQAGPDNKLYFHGGVAAAAGGTLMVPRGDEDLAFRTGEGEQFPSSCCLRGHGKGRPSVSARSRDAEFQCQAGALLALDVSSPLAWPGTLRIFFFLSENGRAYGREGVAGGKARRTCSLWGIRGYVFYGPRGDVSLLSRRDMGRSWF